MNSASVIKPLGLATMLTMSGLLVGCVVAVGNTTDRKGSLGASKSEMNKANVDNVIDAFHAAAAAADERAYFDLLSEDAVFIGTDATERWTKEQFREYCQPYFSQGKGWKYVPRGRMISFVPDSKVAWFDELLDHAKYGVCRGSGVVVWKDGRALIAQYNLSVPIPNERMMEVQQIIQPKAAY